MSETINQKIQSEIEKLKLVANQLPGVVIIHDLRDWSVVWMSELGLKELGITLDELVNLSSEEYFMRFFNKVDSEDYVPKILSLLENNNDEECCTFFQQVAYNQNKSMTWHMSSIKILCRDDFGKPLLTITVSFPIDAMHHMTTKAARLLEENNFLRNNFHQYVKLTKRECEILGLMALGKTSSESAEELFISTSTVETHRKNIKQKLDTSSYYELCQYARAFDLI